MIAAEQWEPAGGLTLEPNAEIAVREIDYSVALTAGPGAGKTELLAQRADFLLQTGQCHYPRRILAISFKVDAARNLRNRVAERCGRTLAARFDSHTFHAFGKRLIDRYRPVLTGVDALDADFTIGPQRAQRTIITFRDLVPLALTIARTSEIARNSIRQTYSHVFLDEFQDCTEEQYELIRALFYGTSTLLTAVGDTKQRIMIWAGALDGIFAKLQADFSARPLILYQNRRSQPVLRRMQNRMVAVMEPAAAMPESEIAGDGGTIDVKHFDNDEQEAQFIAGLARQLIEDGTPPSEIAVLVAKEPHLLAATLMARFSADGIAVRNEQALQDLTAQPIAEAILDGLRVIVSTQQPDAYQRMMALAERFGVDQQTSDRLRAQVDRYIAKAKASHVRGELRYDDAEHLHRIVREYIEILGADAIATLSPDYQDHRRMDELVQELLDRLTEMIADGHKPAGALELLSGQNAVRLLSIHKSKGLEFDTVIVLGVEDETFWSDPDEERCVFFVGVSRAKSKLVLTTAAGRPAPPGSTWRWRPCRHPHSEFLGYV